MKRDARRSNTLSKDFVGVREALFRPMLSRPDTTRPSTRAEPSGLIQGSGDTRMQGEV